MRHSPVNYIIPLLALATSAFANHEAFETTVQPLLKTYCVKCHGGEKVKGDVDFTLLTTPAEIDGAYELWEAVAEVLEFEDMPPEDEENRPSRDEIHALQNWYQEQFVNSVQPSPGDFRPRRLSANEYRNTLRSLLGFDLEVAFIGAEDTRGERSLAIKLLPTDPPGANGFVNDTHGARLSTHIWERYAYLADRALDELFSPKQRDALSTLLGEPLPPGFKSIALSRPQLETLLREFLPRAHRRPVSPEILDTAIASLAGLEGQPLLDAVKAEMIAVLVSPAFLYRGLLMDGAPGYEQAVDSFELAERLSYFLWEDMPDSELIAAASRGGLADRQSLEVQIDRMLASPKTRNLSESFGGQWFGLADIGGPNDPLIKVSSFHSQPLDFLHYLFTEDRPIIELIDSKVDFINYYTANFYPENRYQIPKHTKPVGVESQLAPNQRITFEKPEARGGILTMPGILAMNRGPILRGIWILRNILGERLGEPPADVPPIEVASHDASLTFRERFELHRNDAACARCHDRIDPIGFSLQSYDDNGAYKFASNYKPPKEASEHDDDIGSLDTSGQLPSGETFQTFDELKAILLGSKRRDIIRNAVERTLSYALCRKLEPFDRPAVESITDTLDQTNGSWRDLFVEISLSLPFQKTYLPKKPENES